MAKTDIGKAYVQIVPSAKGIKSGLEDVLGGPLQQTGKKLGPTLGSTLGSGLRNVGAGLTRYVTKPALGAAAAISGATLWAGWKRMTAIDNAKVKLEAIGNSAKDVEGITQSALKSVEGTAYGLDAAMTASASAVAAGVKPGKELTKFLTAISDAAAVAGTDMNDMGYIFNSVATKNKASNKELKEMAQRGIPIYQYLAKELGVSEEKVFELAKSGEINLRTFRKAVSKNIGGAAKEIGSKTITGAIANVKASMSRIGANFLGSADDKNSFAGKMLPFLNNMMKNMKPLEEQAKKWGASFADTIQKVATALSKLDPGTVLKVTGALVAAGPAINTGFKLYDTFNKLKILFPSLKGSFGKLGTAAKMLANPFGVATLAVGAWALGVKKEYDEVHKSTIGLGKYKEAAKKVIDATQNETAVADVYKNQLDELMRKEHKSASDKEKIKTYVDLLNGAIDGLNLKYDEEKDKLNQTSSAIERKIDAYKREALIKAYQDQITEAAKKEAEEQVRLAKLQEKKAKIQEKWAKSDDHGWAAQQGYEASLGKVNKQIKNAEKAIKGYDKEMKRASTCANNMAAANSGAWTKLTKKAKKAGIKIPKSIKQGINSGQVEVPKSMGALNKLLEKKYNATVKKAKASGIKVPKSISKGIASGKLTPAQAAAKLEKYVDNKLSKIEPDSKKTGKKGGRAYGAGIKSGKGTVSAGATTLKDTAKNNLSTSTGPGSGIWNMGHSISEGYANGILGGLGAVASAVGKMVKTAVKKTRKKQKTNSPAKVMIPLGKSIDEGYALGIDRGNPYVTAAASHMVNEAIKASSPVNGREIGAMHTAMLNTAGTSYTFGDITLDAHDLDDVATVEELVTVLRRAKAFA